MAERPEEPDEQDQSETFDETHLDDEGDGDVTLEESDVLDVTQEEGDADDEDMELEDVAALSAALDLVIGPAIAGTNIAAASGAASWMILAPDDWHVLGAKAYPFYPRTRGWAAGSFGQWDQVMAAMAAELARISSARRNAA